jgi:hypothetical protein
MGMEKLAEGAYMDRLVVTEDVDGRLSTHILRYRPSGDWLAIRASGETGWEAYTGEIAIFDGEGDPKAAGHFDEGRVTAQATGKGKAGKSDEMDCTITDISMGGVQQDGVFYVTDIIIEYECSGSGTNDGDPDPGLDNGGGEFPQNGGEPHGGGGGVNGNGEQIPMVIEDELILEEQIIYDNQLLEDYPCQKNIIEDIILISQPISELFQEIFIDSDRAQLIFKVENLAQLEGGNTNWAGNNDNEHLFEITLNSYRLENSTNLDIINTIVHEYTHAVLLYFFYASPNFDIDLNNPPSYAELVQQFSLHREIIGGNNSPSQHEYMANFVSDIAEICLAWCEQNGMDVDLDYLIEISWGGMTDTETFNLLYPEGSNERFNIIESQTNEIFPNSTNNEVGASPCD